MLIPLLDSEFWVLTPKQSFEEFFSLNYVISDKYNYSDHYLDNFFHPGFERFFCYIP